jgi:hypothetical protein
MLLPSSPTQSTVRLAGIKGKGFAAAPLRRAAPWQRLRRHSLSSLAFAGS